MNYVNLKEILESSDEVLYHKRDSHWNNKGAALAGDALMTALDKEHTDYTKESYEECVDFTGDLDEMLYPLALTEEKEIYYDKADVFAYVGEVESNFDPKITTVNPGSTGSSGCTAIPLEMRSFRFLQTAMQTPTFPEVSLIR